MLPASKKLPIGPLRYNTVGVPQGADMKTEVEMKVNRVSVLVSKKIGKNFCSWSLSYGATAEVKQEHFTEVIFQFDTQLRELVSTALASPNGNGNGNGTQPQVQG